ncbi:MAG TPA: beta-N-acetylhexosaminidase [Terracidiphilus sp.]|nr:beta-N-acetylhexosaminidase [Terracidiphilus sp.]
MKMSLRQAAGSLLVVGVEGTELTALERTWLKLVQPAGIILFRRNIESAKQTRSLVAEATKFCAPHSARFVDLEGGTVDRLRDALAPMPAVEAVARAIRASGSYGPACEHGELIAQAAKAFGFNSPLAPVFDLGLPPSQSVLASRCAGATAAEVTAYARAFLAALRAQGVAGCGKHFPGLGGGNLDSHLETPKIRRTWQQLWQEDLAPYRSLRDELPMVMVSHAAYPRTRGGMRPASLSQFWVGDVLRKRIGYRDIVMSDDLEMGGVTNFMPVGEAGVEAVRVGSDMLLICHHAEPILTVYEALISKAEESAAFRKILTARARNAEEKRAKLFRAAIPAALTEKQFAALRAKILKFGEKVEKTGN